MHGGPYEGIAGPVHFDSEWIVGHTSLPFLLVGLFPRPNRYPHQESVDSSGDDEQPPRMKHKREREKQNKQQPETPPFGQLSIPAPLNRAYASFMSAAGTNAVVGWSAMVELT